MLWSKSCYKCNGDLFLEKDVDGWSIACLQCGARAYVTNPIPVQSGVNTSYEPVRRPEKRMRARVKALA